MHRCELSEKEHHTHMYTPYVHYCTLSDKDHYNTCVHTHLCTHSIQICSWFRTTRAEADFFITQGPQWGLQFWEAPLLLTSAFASLRLTSPCRRNTTTIHMLPPKEMLVNQQLPVLDQSGISKATSPTWGQGKPVTLSFKPSLCFQPLLPRKYLLRLLQD
jgi:hypothetical protein